ncbi:salicylate hydroxylase [Streptomyces viridiviolaceus]|uniref:FAD-dependent monooxygenase n=1 Tax=Streptomyces viridiviolaceus TaxID=68282 RepID=A0ABW2ECL7_9ACTN|nr:NAD(P)/FAD-dependent oxidoreductase [Streptomyces viridiviolaceus]GHB73257.1 salicylate hydroxylase [Streptomyces viridiviolaceus]
MSPQTLNSRPHRIEALIVGGSLGGLTTALALASAGLPSTVLERTAGRTQRGVAILVAGARLQRAIGTNAYRGVGRALGQAAISQYALPHAWWDVYSALRDAADAEPLITVVEKANVVEAGQDDASAWARTEDGATWTADVLFGADGYRSVVRRHVDGRRPNATYAGYVVWLGQSELPPAYHGRAGGPDFFSSGSDMLAVYPLVDSGERATRFGWGWFDASRNSLFRSMGAVSGTEVRRTPRTTDIPDDVYASMAAVGERKWAEPWRSGVISAFRDREVVATPITEYVPERVASGRVAVLGDAAHVQTPMTGAGFEEAVADAVAIVDAFDGAVSPEDALRQYELTRLADMRRRVLGGQSFSRSFARR